jgi:hypothetical protein
MLRQASHLPSSTHVRQSSAALQHLDSARWQVRRHQEPTRLFYERV